MAPVRVDDKARTDWRFAQLGRICGRDRRWALGAMIDVWSHCTDAQSYTVRSDALDVIGDVQGFAEALIRSELGELQDEGLIRIRGTKGRIEWLAGRRLFSARGGAATKAKWEAKRGPEGLVMAMPNEGPLTLSLSLSPETKRERACAREPSLSPLDMPKVKKRTAATPGPALLLKARSRVEALLYVEWFNRRFGSRYQVHDDTVRAVKVLLDDGRTQGEMRLVALCKHSQWEDDEKMQQQIKPSTLLRRLQFGERLDEAREKFPERAAACSKLDEVSLAERVHKAAMENSPWWDTTMREVATALHVLGIELPEPRLLALPGGQA